MKTKTKKATPKKQNRSKHTILLTSRIETRPMTDAEAKALVGTIKTELDAAFAMIPKL